MGVLLELGIADPMPALNAPVLTHQLQQCFWGGAQAREKAVGDPERLALTDPGGTHLDDPAGAAPFRSDVFWCLFSSQRPGDVPTVADLVILCQVWDLALPLELAANLTMQCLLVSYSFGEDWRL